MKKTIIILLSIILIFTLVGCADKEDSSISAEPAAVSTTGAPEAIGPYSQAQTVGGFVFTSGQIGLDPATGELREGLEAQCEQVFKNLSAVLEAAESDIGKSVKTTIYITDMNDFAVVNGIYEKYFSEPYPARSCVEVSELPKGALVECEIIAVK